MKKIFLAIIFIFTLCFSSGCLIAEKTSTDKNEEEHSPDVSEEQTENGESEDSENVQSVRDEEKESVWGKDLWL